MSVKRAEMRDVKSILFIINTSVRDSYKSIIPPEQFRDPVLTFEQLVKESKLMAFYVYSLENKFVGVAALQIIKRENGIVRWVHVLPEYRRLGVGSSMIKYIESEAKKIGLKKLQAVYVWEKAYWAKNFYTKLGYKKGKTVTLPWGDQAHIYEKILS
jgi:N-acetylglutamate synthase-like GNAT family acetyltransferase